MTAVRLVRDHRYAGFCPRMGNVPLHLVLGVVRCGAVVSVVAISGRSRIFRCRGARCSSQYGGLTTIAASSGMWSRLQSARRLPFAMRQSPGFRKASCFRSRC